MFEHPSQSVDEFAAGRKHLESLVAEESTLERNEATTRLQLIDPLLMDCLRWLPEDITSEDQIDGQRTDYLVGKPTPRIVLEAKRENKTFSLPSGVSGRVVELQTLMVEPDVAEAVDQVRAYCQDRSIPVAVASNGHQLIAFLASRQDGVRPLDGKALVFRSLQDMLDDFKTLWESLSPAGLAQATLQRKLGVSGASSAPPQKLSGRIVDYPGFRQRTELETDLKILGQLFLLDLAGEGEVTDDFLRSCYCPSGALSQYALVSREILRTRYALTESSISDIAPVQEKKGVTSKLTPNVLASALSRRPVLLLGDVGVGKTIFLKHLLRVDASDVLENAIVLYLDFGMEPAVAEDLSAYVANRLIEQMREDFAVDVFDASLVRAVYNAEINRFKKSVAGRLQDTDPAAYAAREVDMLEALLTDRGEHVRRCLEHLRGTSKRGLVVVLDNVDQRPPKFQDEVFLIGEGIAEGWPATVFVALRPSTFHESRRKGTLSGYHSRAFSVYPARTDEVIGRRLKFARRQLEETGRLESFPEGLSLDSSNLIAYLDVLIKAFDSDDALKEMLDNLSGGNVRQALDFLNAFVGSAYVSTKRILDIARQQNNDVYTVPLHEFFRAITFGDAEYYDPSTSPIANLFDVVEDDGREHFLLPSLIVEAQRLGESAGGPGFIPIQTLHEHGAAAGFRQEQVGGQLARAFQKRLLEGDVNGPSGETCRPTTVGAYSVRKLVGMFSYVDAIVIDTPIVDAVARETIQDVRSILDRVARARAFRAYLDRQWTVTVDTGLAFDWPSASGRLERSISDAEARAGRAEARRVSVDAP